jgi:hypothetical protein
MDTPQYATMSKSIPKCASGIMGMRGGRGRKAYSGSGGSSKDMVVFAMPERMICSDQRWRAYDSGKIRLSKEEKK